MVETQDKEKLKQIIVVRADLKLPKGKLAAQVAHAAVLAMKKAEPHIVKEWEDIGMAKIVLRIDSEKELIKLFQYAKDAGLKPALVTDAGRTIIAPETKTCFGIGPATSEELDDITSE